MIMMMTMTLTTTMILWLDDHSDDGCSCAVDYADDHDDADYDPGDGDYDEEYGEARFRWIPLENCTYWFKFHAWLMSNNTLR